MKRRHAVRSVRANNAQVRHVDALLTELIRFLDDGHAPHAVEVAGVLGGNSLQ